MIAPYNIIPIEDRYKKSMTRNNISGITNFNKDNITLGIKISILQQTTSLSYLQTTT